MKKHTFVAIAVLVLMFMLAVPAFSQTNYSYKSEHYTVTTGVSDEFTRKTAAFLEAFYDLYSGYLHFDPKDQPATMQVVIYGNAGSYQAALEGLIGESRSSFVFLQYSDPKKSKLLGYYPEDPDTLNKKLIHHGFVQYIKTFVPNPPLWLQKGFAVYFENCVYDEVADKVVFHPNYSWVDTLREKLSVDPSLTDSEVLIPVNNLLYLDQDTAVQNLEAFYSQTWGMIDFLIHSEKKDYNRLLWDSISALSATGSLEDNQKAIVRDSFEWVDRDSLVSDFVVYIDSLRTFPDLISDGIDAYSSEDLDAAEASFQKAVSLRADHYVPLYYLGLIYYNRGEYSMAEYYYLQAVKNNGHADLLYYALGVNAYADSRLDDSTFYLKQAVDAEGSYSDRASELMKEIASTAEESGGAM